MAVSTPQHAVSDDRPHDNFETGEKELIAIDRRVAPRFPIKSKVAILTENGDRFFATAINISSSGMLVQLNSPSGESAVEQPALFRIGDAVTVTVELPNGCDKPLSPWGIGVVVRVEECRSAVELRAGSFYVDHVDSGEVQSERAPGKGDSET